MMLLSGLLIGIGFGLSNPALLALLTELEFQSIRDRLIKKAGAVDGSTQEQPADYYTLKSLAAIAYQVEQWRRAELLACDT